MVEATLLDKLRKIEALHAGATTEGERGAARAAAERIKARLAEQRAKEPDVDLMYALPDPWERMLFVALCRRYGLRPYRRYRQRSSTVMVCAPEAFQRRTLWPQFEALSTELTRHLHDVTERVIHEAIHGDAGEAEEVAEPKALPGS
jgi:hypothetical protein